MCSGKQRGITIRQILRLQVYFPVFQELLNRCDIAFPDSGKKALWISPRNGRLAVAAAAPVAVATSPTACGGLLVTLGMAGEELDVSGPSPRLKLSTLLLEGLAV